jgi:hypothetical protein
MEDAILALALVLSGGLLAYTTYAALWGLAGALTGRAYERCPHCHSHYLADKTGAATHQCFVEPEAGLLHALLSRAHQAHHAHHAHTGRN